MKTTKLDKTIVAVFILLLTSSLFADSKVRVINVKDFGAKGDGSTDDSAAIKSAIAALPQSNAKLYFPAGDYRCGTIVITGKKHLTICGDGWPCTIIKSNANFDAGDGRGPTPGGQVINIDAACSDIEVSDLTFDGSCTHRKPGQQAVIIDSDNTTFRNNFTINSGEFANCFGRNNAAGMDNLIVKDNRVGLNWADGINLNKVHGGIVSNNMVDGANDDLIAVSESNNVTIAGNHLRSRIDLPSKVGRGIAVLWGCNNITGSANYIEQVKQYGLYITSEDSGARPKNIVFSDTTIRNAPINSGDAVFVVKADNVTLINTIVSNPPTGDCILIGDWTNLSIVGGCLTQTLNRGCRGIHAIENAGLAAKWTGGLTIKDVQINMLGAGTYEAIYLQPHDSVKMEDILITGVTARTACTNSYIFVNSAKCEKSLKIINNVSVDGRTITPPKSDGIVTVANNN